MNDIENNVHNDIMEEYQKSDNILDDIQIIIDTSQKEAYRAVNTILVRRNWLIGYRIAEEELEGDNRAEYGPNIIKKLSKELTVKYEKVIQKLISIIFICFIRISLGFSTQCVENLKDCYHGHITGHYCR